MGEGDAYDALRINLGNLLKAAKAAPALNRPSSPLQLEAIADISKSSIYRLLDDNKTAPRQPLGLDKLVAIATAYGVPAWTLLQTHAEPTRDLVAISEANLEALIDEEAEKLFKEATHASRKLKAKGKAGRPSVRYPFADSKAPKEGKAGAAPSGAKGRPATAKAKG